jgi:outer membrane protein insertion porin family/translocation and assembly module TamA
VQAEYLQPYWLDDRTDFRLRTGWEQEDLESYTNQRTFLNGAVSRRLSEVWRARLGYKLEDNRLEKIKILDSDESQELFKNNQYLESAVNFGVTRRTVDDVLYPTQGSEWTLAFEQASGLIGSELKYVRPTAEVKSYCTFSFPVTLAFRLKLESIQEIEDTAFIPISERLFLGGSNTVRGYGYQKLGPLDSAGKPLIRRSGPGPAPSRPPPDFRLFPGAKADFRDNTAKPHQGSGNEAFVDSGGEFVL